MTRIQACERSLVFVCVCVWCSDHSWKPSKLEFLWIKLKITSCSPFHASSPSAYCVINRVGNFFLLHRIVSRKVNKFWLIWVFFVGWGVFLSRGVIKPLTRIEIRHAGHYRERCNRCFLWSVVMWWWSLCIWWWNSKRVRYSDMVAMIVNSIWRHGLCTLDNVE